MSLFASSSPGGDAVASDEILHELKLLSKAKPMVVSMSDLAASGGYLMSMAPWAILSFLIPTPSRNPLVFCTSGQISGIYSTSLDCNRMSSPAAS